MTLKRISLVLGFSQLLFACGSESSRPNPEEGGKPSETAPNPPGMAVAWDETTPLGVSPAEAFAELTGSCKAPFRWESVPDDFSILEPPSGSSEVSVTVTFDDGSARFFPCKTGECAEHLVATAHVSVASADGNFVDEGDVRATYYKAAGANSLDLRVEAADLGGKARITTSDARAEASLTYTVTSLGDACQGQVDQGLSIPNEDGRGRTSFDGKLGSWTSNGCPSDTEPVDLFVPLPSGESLKDSFDQAFRARRYSGTWTDEEKATLYIAVAGLPDKACKRTSFGSSDTVAEVRLEYSTDDGRLLPTSTLAYLRIGVALGGNTIIEITADDHFRCASSDTSLPYTPARCNEGTSSIWVSVLIDDYLGESSARSAAEISVYQYTAGSDGSGEADAIQTFSGTSQ